MSWIVRHVDRIMILSGVLTLTMVYAAIAPKAALLANFGSTLEGPVAEIVVRNWGALITVIGGLLIYGARRPEVRPAALVVAAASKAIFVALVLVQGREFLGHQVGIAVGIDALWVVVFSAYLIATGGGAAHQSKVEKPVARV